jgi:glycosyltransferase involved in cell wall biosynthesis
MTRPRSFPGFVLHVIRHLPSVIREKRVPITWKEIQLRARVSFASFAERHRVRNLPSRSSSARKGLIFLSHNLNAEGAPRSLLAIVNGLKGEHDVLVISMEPGPMQPRFEEAGIAVVVVNPIWDALDEESYERGLDLLVEGARHWGADLVFANTLMCFWGVTLARRLGVSSIWCVRESVDWRVYFDYLPKRLTEVARQCLRETDHLLFVADATRKLFDTLARRKPVHTIHTGIELSDIENFKANRSRRAARAALGFEDADAVVTVIGTTCERKGQIDFLRAAEILERRGDARWRFLVVGARPSPYQTRLETYVRTHQLETVRFVPETPEVFEYYRASDVFVCSSHQESFPRVVLEAMAFELPIVATNVYGIPEMVTHEESGLLVPAGDPAALSESIHRVPRDESLASRLSARAYAKITRELTLDRMVEKYRRLVADCFTPQGRE